MAKTGREMAVPSAVRHAGALFKDMERIFEDAFTGRWLQLHNGPSVDVIEHDDEVVVRAAVPGYRKEELSASVEDGMLTIEGETRAEKKEEKEDYYRCEISRGAFSRSVGLPASVDGSKAKATVKDGVLELTLPKAEKAKRHSIAIS